MSCTNSVGVKNVLITFRSCDTDQVISKVSHKLATDDIPKVRTCEDKNEALPGGRSKRTQDSPTMELMVIRDLRVPLSFYQGCASMDVQIEYYNGLIYTGFEGVAVGDSRSDAHDIELEIVFERIDELLPANQVALAA
jgi:hypothetical protein